MKYYLDCEFNGYRGELISLALVDEAAERKLYVVSREFYHREITAIPWVAENVMPILFCPGVSGVHLMPIKRFGEIIEEFLRGDPLPTIIADWPDDIRYFCECLITGPGQMIESAATMQFVVERVDAYPTDLPGAVQHNALWDARALRHKMAPRWRYQRKEGWGNIWRETETDPSTAGFFETPGDWTVERLPPK